MFKWWKYAWTKWTLNEMDKEKINYRFNFNCAKINYRFNFNCARVCEKVFIYHNFPDTEVVIIQSKIGPLYLANLISSR